MSSTKNTLTVPARELQKGDHVTRVGDIHCDGVVTGVSVEDDYVELTAILPDSPKSGLWFRALRSTTLCTVERDLVEWARGVAEEYADMAMSPGRPLTAVRLTKGSNVIVTILWGNGQVVDPMSQWTIPEDRLLDSGWQIEKVSI